MFFSPQVGVIVKAWASLLLGALTLVLAVWTNVSSSGTLLLLAGISFGLAVLLGVRAQVEVRRSGGQFAGNGPAVLGTGIAAFALVPVLVGWEESVRWAAFRAASITYLKSIGQAMHAYHAEHGHLPPAALRDKQGRPLLSWRVLLLPYLEQRDLFKKFRLDEPWDSRHNLPLLNQIPRIYNPLIGIQGGEINTTFFQVFVGKGTPFEGEGLTLAKIEEADGCANTILVVEAEVAVPWTKPEDLTFRVDQPLPPLGDSYKKEYYINPKGRYLALFADGSVRCFFHNTPEELIRPLVTWDGGEAVDWNQLEPWCRGMRGEATLGKPGPQH
jgi:hypothetical protein